MRHRLLKFIKSPVVGTIMLAGILFFGTAFYLHETGALSPGPLSAAQPTGQPLGGFASHASFEHECGHCHAPIHCITDTRCQDCHKDVAEQRVTAQGLHGRLPAGRCQACHVEHQGREAVITEFAFANVNHNKLAGFSLDRHRQDFDGTQMTCHSCHSQDRFAKETLDCLTCHSRADHDRTAEHMELVGIDCLRCHDGLDRMANFDHNQPYALDGQHEGLLCLDCHADQLFAETSRACADCHEDPDMHAGQFGLDCARCHTAAGWAPAQLTQHTFPLDHGAQETLACETCHVDTYVEPTCYGCHDHTPSQMQQTHLQEGIAEFDNCAACHPTGQPDEARLMMNENSGATGDGASSEAATGE